MRPFFRTSLTTYDTSFQLPFPPNEHHLPPGALNVSVSVYDDEPSSIIAYTLASRSYLNFLKLRIEHKQAQRASKSDETAKRRDTAFYADAAVQQAPLADVQVGVT